MKTMNEILLRRKTKFILEKGDATEPNNQYVATIMKNVEALGYTFSKELFETLQTLQPLYLNRFYKELIPMLKEMVGANVKYNPFYRNFPEEVMSMSDTELFINAIVAYWTDCTVLIREDEQERLPLLESPNLKVIDLGTVEDIHEIFNNLCQSKTSISQTDKEDLEWIFKNMQVKFPDEIPLKENVALVGKLYLENYPLATSKDIQKYFKTATDVLRLITAMSDGDISLAENTKFRSFKRKERRLLLELLQGCGYIEEDMLRYKNRWIRIGERLHPSEYDEKQFGKVITAFNKLRNGIKIPTFNGKVANAIEVEDYKKALSFLKTRPGELARKLDYLLRNASDKNSVVNTFKDVASDISTPVLLQVKEHFAHRASEQKSRVFFPKGNLAKCYCIENNLDEIDAKYCKAIVKICENALIEIYKSKDFLGNVYLDENIKGYCVPQSQRSASKSLKNVTRGSRFKIKDDANFIRLGIHWLNELYNERECRTDIDLSCSFLDENFSNVDHISFTHLRNSFSVHSGDLTDAPRSRGGSAEFIDIDIEKAYKSGIRYAAVQIYGYTHTKFCDLDEMIFNWQECVDSEFGDIFEPTRVQQSMNLGFNTDCGIPVVFDLEKREVIWLDMALTTKTNFPRCVEGNVKGLSASVMGIVQSHKPQMYDLAMLHIAARGILVDNREDADVIISNDTSEVVQTKDDTEKKEIRYITTWDTDIWQGEML